jgi:hypothetical protein
MTQATGYLAETQASVTGHTPATPQAQRSSGRASVGYLGGAGVYSVSLLRPGSGFGLGLGAFFVSLRPLSLFPMDARMTQKELGGKKGGDSLAFRGEKSSRICLQSRFRSAIICRCARGKSLDCHKHHGFRTRPTAARGKVLDLPMRQAVRASRQRGRRRRWETREEWQKNPRILRRRARL